MSFVKTMIYLYYRKCLATGYFMNSAELQKEGEYMSVSETAFNLIVELNS